MSVVILIAELDHSIEFFENDDIYVEEENHGRILRGDNEGNLRWEFIWNSLINWSRYISEEEFKI